jgi:phospholipase/lecithinase/hemolysin
MRFRTGSFFLATAVLAAAVAIVPAAAQGSFGRIVVFGTSLSDPGNAFALRGAASTPPDYHLDPLLVPGAPYATGGLHFSNGATWIEQFARSRGLAGNVRPALLSADPNASNYAVGGARAREDGQNFNLSQQVNAFLQQFGGVAPSDALYVVEMGGNDVRDALLAYSSGGAGEILDAADTAIEQNITALHRAGARNFLLWSAPNVGLTPALRRYDQLSPGAAFLATSLSFGFNRLLDQTVVDLSGLEGITIRRLDSFALTTAIVANRDAFGLANVTAACVTPNVAPFTCASPDEYLFWDGIHPTRAAHGIIAQETAAVLGR